MTEITRLSGGTDWIDLGYVERERTPRRLMELGIHLHLAGLSLSNTVAVLERFGVSRSRKAVHDWVQKAELQPTPSETPNQIAVDLTAIRINTTEYWLYTAVDPATNQILHLKLSATYNLDISRTFFAELSEKCPLEETTILVDGAWHLRGTLDRLGLRFQYERHGNRNSAERVIRELKRRTSSFSNCFSHTTPLTAQTWLDAFAVWHNSLN